MVKLICFTKKEGGKKTSSSDAAAFFCFFFLDPLHWAAQFPSCGGLRQSPINIVTSKVHMNTALPPFDFIGHTDVNNITVENRGHSGKKKKTTKKQQQFSFCSRVRVYLQETNRVVRTSICFLCSSLSSATVGPTDWRSVAGPLQGGPVPLPLGREWATRLGAHHRWRQISHGGKFTLTHITMVYSRVTRPLCSILN